MPGKSYDPDRLDVLIGTTVTWHNDDSTNHTVTADGDAFSSGFVPPGGTFSFAFDKQGTFAFHCSIHRFMKGTVTVFGLVLAGPTEPVALGRQVALTGLAPAGTTTVTLRGGERERTVRPRADRSFALGVRATRPAVYRAFAGRLASRSVTLTVDPPSAPSGPAPRSGSRRSHVDLVLVPCSSATTAITSAGCPCRGPASTAPVGRPSSGPQGSSAHASWSVVRAGGRTASPRRCAPAESPLTACRCPPPAAGTTRATMRERLASPSGYPAPLVWRGTRPC